MWRNAEVLDFVGWLRAHNDRVAGGGAGFYGLDLYSLYASIDEVIAYLERVDPAGGGAGARALRLLRAVRRTSRPTVAPRASGSPSPAATPSSPS